MDLGLAPDEFFELTPRQLSALGQAHERQRRGDMMLWAALRADVINSGMRAPKRPVRYEELMPPEQRGGEDEGGAAGTASARRPTARRRREIAESWEKWFAKAGAKPA